MSAVPNPCTMHPDWWTVWLAGFTAGHLAGYELHRTEADAVDEAMWAECSRQVRAQANSPTYAQLCDRRGEPERAARARAHARRLGLVSS